MNSITFAAVICEADDPCAVRTAYAPESSSTMSPRSTTYNMYFWYSTSLPYPVTMLASSRASPMPCPLRLLHQDRLWHWNELVYRVVTRHRRKSFACNVVFMFLGLRWFHSLPCGFMRFHCTTIHCYGILLGCNFRLCSFVQPCGDLLHGMAGVIGISSFILAFLRISRWE